MKKLNLIRLLASVLVVFLLSSIVCSSINSLNLSHKANDSGLSKKENVPFKSDSQLLYEEKETDFDADENDHDYLFFISFVRVPHALAEEQTLPSFGLPTGSFFLNAPDVPLYLAKRTLLI